jgi:hypothetical protein
MRNPDNTFVISAERDPRLSLDATKFWPRSGVTIGHQVSVPRRSTM